jgi:hypothetical protein
MKLSQAKTIIKAMIQHNLNLKPGASNAEYLIPMLWSQPGEGKTTMVEDLARELSLEVETVIVAQFDYAELGGFPKLSEDGEEYNRARPFFLPREGCADTIVFLDELPQAVTANQNVMAQLVNERRIGEHVLPSNVTLVGAGNPMTSRAGTSQMPSHLKDRLTHLDIDTDHQGFRTYALSKGFLPEVTGFIENRPEWLQKFDPSANASPTPRSWERANTILRLGLEASEERHALKGQIGEAALTDFAGYLRIYRDLPNVEDIFNAPEAVEVPGSPDILYALCSNLAHKASVDNAEALITFIKRFPSKEFAAFCVRDVLGRNPALKKDKNVAGWVVTEGRDLLL